VPDLHPAEEHDAAEVHPLTWPPRARDLPDWRAALVRAWTPTGTFTRIAPFLEQATAGIEKFQPEWEHAKAREAQLWWVGSDMCDLLEAAAPQLPATRLHPDLWPDKTGLVYFERPLRGIDADGTGHVVRVGAMLWGPGWWNDRPCLGVTVYGPIDELGPHLVPLGTLVWPIGESTDARLEGTRQPGPHVRFRVDPERAGTIHDREPDPEAVYESMSEDRRVLLALWLLSAEPSITAGAMKDSPPAATTHDRATARRAAREGTSPAVRVVLLRRPVPDTSEGGTTLTGTGRHLHHRFPVTGYWKNVAYGPGYTLHRPKWIAPHMKGPAGAPLLTSPKVKKWTRE
jgi:hypothetical protein